MIHIRKRIRYNFWMALADVGGMHDGFFLILGLIVGPFSAISFENDLLKGKLFKRTSSQHRSNPQPEELKMAKMIKTVEGLKAVALSRWVSVLDCVLRGVKRNRRQKIVGRLQKRYLH